MSESKAVDQAFLETLLEKLQAGPLGEMDLIEREIFQLRYQLLIPDVLRVLEKLYGERADFSEQLEKLLEITASNYANRSSELRRLDLRRQSSPDWFQQSTMIGYVCYVDRFAGNLSAIREKIPYLKELGVTYLHLMPLLKPREGANDGGYAVQDYRQINPTYGTMDDLAALTGELRRNGISLCIDLVCNHTAKEHDWARRAVAGDPHYRDYYLMYADRMLPDQYEANLPEVFPDFAPGNFTWYEDCQRWVWTTFNEYQWDLNYRNPAVLGEILDIILYLANQGVEVVRLDAVAFMWKRMGTDCQNQREVHTILQALRTLSRMAAPGVIFKAEAIVAPDKLIWYLGRGRGTGKECELAYHNVFMVLLWSMLAERNVRLATHALQRFPDNSSSAAWNTYARCHDDIGWAIMDEDAAAVGLNGFAHRSFLSDFYSGEFPGTFARGGVFQFNPRTGDRRISGSLASLTGLETAQQSGDASQMDLAIRRVLLLHNLIFAFGGVPLIYMGDELGLLNDPSYLDNPDLADDNRWMHRPWMDWQRAEQRHDLDTVSGQIFAGLLKLIQARKHTYELHAQARTHVVWTHNDQVLGILRDSARGRLLILANVTEQGQGVAEYRLKELGFSGALVDRLDNRQLSSGADVHLEPYQVIWLEQYQP